jgi:hypothetical protein
MQPYGLPYPSPELHEDAKKKLHKKQLLAETKKKRKKCKKNWKLLPPPLCVDMKEYKE